MLQVRPKPAILKPTDAIVRMVKTTICGDPCLPTVLLLRTSNELAGTDLHILKGDVATCDTGRILGHEGVGVVESAGEGVMKFKPGDNVIVSCITSCSTCDYCRKGMPSHCVHGGWKLGNTIDGTQAEYVRIPHADGSLHLMVEGATAEEQIMISDALPTGFECGVLSGRVRSFLSNSLVVSNTRSKGFARVYHRYCWLRSCRYQRYGHISALFPCSSHHDWSQR